jgi:anterior pharynx defective protein 1
MSKKKKHATVPLMRLILVTVGLGFGLMCGAFSLMNVLADSSGPGALGMRGEPQVIITTDIFVI